MALLEEAEKGDENSAREAQIMAMEMGVSIEQAKMGILPELSGKPQSPANAMPLLGDSGQVGTKPSTMPARGAQGGMPVG